MSKRKPLRAPKSDDPLSEPTPQRRLWAARIRAGYKTRQSFVAALGVSYSTVNDWDQEKANPAGPTLRKACELVSISEAEYWKGHAGTARPSTEQPKIELTKPTLGDADLERLSDLIVDKLLRRLARASRGRKS